ncbi:MAG: heme ABC transporter permease CcmC [Pseudomonadota bacterium]
MSIWRYANPAAFMRLSGHVVAPLWWLAGAMLAVGLVWSLSAPPDYQQGSTVLILFIHVPAALLAINTYFLMAVASAIGLVRRHHVSFLVAKAAAPIGAAFTAVALVTGAVWGQPMWGTWWVWDARLTAVLIMFFFYLGYMALWAAIDDPDKAADLTAVLCLTGVVFSVLARYAVVFWATLHQGASLSVAEGQRVDDAYRDPLYFMMAAFYVLFLALLLTRTRTEIRRRRARALRTRALAEGPAPATAEGAPA